MQTRPLLLAKLLTLLATSAFAQAPNALNILGVVERIDAAAITVKVDGGAIETFALAPVLVVLQNKTITLADIKPNDFVASAAVRKEDGKLHSTELRIFPEALRGVGEGQRPMNDARNQTMTNATVTGAVVVNGSNNIKVKFANGGESELILDPGVPVTRIDNADRALLKAGAKVRVQGERKPEGAVVARVTLQ